MLISRSRLISLSLITYGVFLFPDERPLPEWSYSLPTSVGTQVQSWPQVKLIYTTCSSRIKRYGRLTEPLLKISDSSSLQKSHKAKTEYCCHIIAGATQSSLSSPMFNIIYAALCWMMNLPPSNPFPKVANSVSIDFQDKFSDMLHCLVTTIQSFTAKAHHVSFGDSNLSPFYTYSNWQEDITVRQLFLKKFCFVEWMPTWKTFLEH